jgi:hypothetical protein
MRKRRFQRATEEIEGICCLAPTSACGRVRDIEVKGDPWDGARASCPPRFIGVSPAVKL